MRNRCNDSDEERGHGGRTRREILKAGAALVVAPFLGGVATTVEVSGAANGSRWNVQDTATEWLSYGGDKASSKYSPLAQISGRNFNRLKTAWTLLSRPGTSLGYPAKSQLAGLEVQLRHREQLGCPCLAKARPTR
jgi:hypothetical protein